MPKLTKYANEQAMDAATRKPRKIRKETIQPEELEVFTWKCTCRYKVRTQIRVYDVMCGTCKKGMECNNKRGTYTEKEYYAQT